MADDDVFRDATFSPCGRYRYRLERRWKGNPGDTDALAIVGLNPSTADRAMDDATVRRCVGFARRAGFPAVVLVNLYAWRSTDPRALGKVDDPIGPDNDRVLRTVLAAAPMALAAWGARAPRGRVEECMALRARWHCLKVLRGGAPGHPLYLPADSEPAPWVSPTG